MQKIYLLLLAFCFLNTAVVFANKPIDSIGVENYKGNKLILHKVEAKETYYAISRKYKIPYQEIMTFNDDKALGVGVVIKVPTKIPFEAIAAGKQTVNKSSGTFEYTIQKKDNLNALAERFGTTVDAIKQENDLRSINLQIGQVLMIPGNQANTNSTAITRSVEANTIKNSEEKMPIAAISVIEHTVQKKEYLGVIAKNYNVTTEQIRELNGLNSNALNIGQVLKIPSNSATNIAAPAKPAVAEPAKNRDEKYDEPVADKLSKYNSIEYIVKANETIYTIAKKYSLTTYQIKIANKLSNDDLKVGQKLILKNNKPIEAFQETAVAEEDDSALKNPSLKYPASRYGLSQIEEKGTAVWINDADLDAAKMLILHRTAPVGTVIKVTNPMNNRSTLAKVVGKYTENETTKDVIIVMTKAVADAVGALDKRFFCNLTYGVQENVQ